MAWEKFAWFYLTASISSGKVLRERGTGNDVGASAGSKGGSQASSKKGLLIGPA